MVNFNMYQGIKYCVSFNGTQSSFFPCLRRVRQGEKLSPVVFALFINDLEDVMKAHSCSGISLKLVSEDLYFYLKHTLVSVLWCSLCFQRIPF